jgi:hypothetical protein
MQRVDAWKKLFSYALERLKDARLPENSCLKKPLKRLTWITVERRVTG